MPAVRKIVESIKETMPQEKKKRGRPKGSTKIKSPWFTFICPKCGGVYGFMSPNAEFTCYANGCKGTVCKMKGK